MAKREIFYGGGIWRDPNFDVTAAREWLVDVKEGDPILLEVLTKIASGCYHKINRKITDFVIELQRSKHSDNDEIMDKFFCGLIEDLIKRIDLEKVTLSGLSQMRKNKVLVDHPNILVEIDRIILDRSNALLR